MICSLVECMKYALGDFSFYVNDERTNMASDLGSQSRISSTYTMVLCTERVDHGCNVDVIPFDFAKTFDVVVHDFLSQIFSFDAVLYDFLI